MYVMLGDQMLLVQHQFSIQLQQFAKNHSNFVVTQDCHSKYKQFVSNNFTSKMWDVSVIKHKIDFLMKKRDFCITHCSSFRFF